MFSAEVVNLRFGSNGDKNRIVIDLSEDISFSNKIYKKKIEIKFKKKVKLRNINKKADLLDDIIFNEDLNQISLLFKKEISSPNIYLLKKKNHKYSRIVFDYYTNKLKKKIIVIDPGHGGKDSGAVGIGKNFEKNITLKVGLLLKKKIEKTGQFKVFLTRSSDKYLRLRERTKIAKKNNADIFISLHADFNPNRRTRGISIYTLSERASDKEAEALARRENRSDLIDGVDLSSESSEVTNILLDLTKRDTLNQSSYLVNFMIKEFKKNLNLLQRPHRFAGFTVLKSLDIPSVLVEMGYLSNSKDSKLLVSKEYQEKLSENILGAIRNYFYWKEQNNS